MSIPNIVPRIVVSCVVGLVFFAAGAYAQVAKIGPGDAVKLTVRGVPDTESQMVSGMYKVDQSGQLVGLPYLEGSIQAAGLTEGQLSQNIASAYRSADIYTEASFTAIVDTPLQARKITVGGKVARQGPLDYYDNMTIFDAFSAAGGADRFGQKKRVFLIRSGEAKKTYNMDRDEDKKVRLLPNDTIVVDQKGAFEP